MTTNQATSEPPSIRIAYAEDHNLVRETVIGYLQKLGGVDIVIEANNGMELIQMLTKAIVLPQVCLVDIVMPEMNGFETVAMIKHKWPDMRILVLTGYMTEDYLIKMILAGVDGYLTKNASPLEIKKAIIEVDEHGWYSTSTFTQKFVNLVRNRKHELPHLTANEIQLLKFSIEDKTFHEIAELMNTSTKGVEGLRSRLYAKLGIKTRAGLVVYAVTHGYVTIDKGISTL